MSEPRQSIHDGWTPQPQEQIQPGDPWFNPEDESQDEASTWADPPAPDRAAGLREAPEEMDFVNGREAWEAGYYAARDAAPLERRLIEALRSLDAEWWDSYYADRLRSAILAIEQEAASKAVAEVLDRLERGVDALQSPPRYENDRNGNWWSTDMEYGWDMGTEDARALIASERER